uniref:HTH myb-type domain-containing protein n=1 Tax=Rhodosorus marinus TaxID=101924 RepID=A0A7S0BJA1_9RHOD
MNQNQEYIGGAGASVSDGQFRGATMPARMRKPYHSRRMRQAWTEEEHCRFVEAVSLYKRDWKRIEEHVKTKDILQIRSHAQKYFMKVKKQSTGEYVPPPRPKKKAAHPYPRQRVQAPEQVYSKPQHTQYIHSHMSSMSSRHSGSSSSPSLDSRWLHQTPPHRHWGMPIHHSMYRFEDMYPYPQPAYEYPATPLGMYMWRTPYPCHRQACSYSHGEHYCRVEERSHHPHFEAAMIAKRYRSIRRDKLDAARRRIQEEKMDDDDVDESGSESGSVEVATGSSITKDSYSEEESDFNSSVNE